MPLRLKIAYDEPADKVVLKIKQALEEIGIRMDVDWGEEEEESEVGE